MNGQTNVPSKERNVKTLANFSAVDAANASGDSLRTTVKVTAGLFKSQTSRFVEGIGKIDTPFEGDNLKRLCQGTGKGSGRQLEWLEEFSHI